MASRRALTVVAIGASAGGLEASKKLVDALPVDSGMAFILVQHLDPLHESMMVDLLAGRTKMPVHQAQDGHRVEADHVYVIPPGVYLTVEGDVLHLASPCATQSVRLPFDALLTSVAAAFDGRSVCIVLSGTGSDGSVGLKAIHAAGGLVIAQNPEEAGYDGMPRSAILTGMVDLILKVEEMPGALAKRTAQGIGASHPAKPSKITDMECLDKILDLLRTKTPHDFTLYKRGTLQRRIDRRRGLMPDGPVGARRYLEILQADPAEIELLAEDLLINVTGFFRDAAVFSHVSEAIIPAMLARHPPSRPLRIWIAGCSTGEEAYSLAIAFRERILAEKLPIRLQFFASDVDADAIATAREGLYPRTIEADVSPERLARFFHLEEHGYRVTSDLRAQVVFTVQDLLGDPPFSRLDLISCRNLLIYLGLEAQNKVIALFHFALNEGGILLLGSAETISNADDRFELISKPFRLYRHIARSRPVDLRFALNPTAAARPLLRANALGGPRPSVLAELCRRLVLETYAPAAVLVNRAYDCLYSLGPTQRILTIPSGPPSQNLFAMAPPLIHAPLRSALHRAETEGRRVIVPTASSARIDGSRISLAVEPLRNDGELLFLVCFDTIGDETSAASPRPATAAESARADDLQRELAETRTELEHAIRNLEIAAEEQRAINEEALSVNEEYQSTNEELLASKEELQSLNEELIALNTQLQETLDRQRVTSTDLQNVLYSTDVATIFLDPELRIRFFTPATRSLFAILPGDIGRPLADLMSLAIDEVLFEDARAVLTQLTPIEREIRSRKGDWYIRRILPYRTLGDGVEGVVVTFTDITERRRTIEALALAERQAQRANAAKTRFLAAASHDLRQPLQTLSLLQALLARHVTDDKAQALIQRFDDTLGVMADMLNTLLDINQIEAGTVRPDLRPFAVTPLLTDIQQAFHLSAEALGLDLRVVPSRLVIESDPALLEQILRNLVSNALKYTRTGRILIGCRRRKGLVDIEIWDTGIGIPAEQLQAIFEEYHQVDNVARQRDRGLGLGLAIVQRLSNLLGHRIRVRSQPGKGSVFTVTVPRAFGELAPVMIEHVSSADESAAAISRTILIIEDDPDVRGLLDTFLTSIGHRIAAAGDGNEALELVTRRSFRPELILADYSLPSGENGLSAAQQVCHLMGRQVPVIVLTGDISTETLQDIALHHGAHLAKPVALPALTQMIEALSDQSSPQTEHLDAAPAQTTIYVVDDDPKVLEAIRSVLEEDHRKVETFVSAEAYLIAWKRGQTGCLLVDAYLPGKTGLELLTEIAERDGSLPAIMMTGRADVGIAVSAMKAGALDFIEKPVSRDQLLAAVDHALELTRNREAIDALQAEAAQHLTGLTPRQRQIMDLVLAGHPSKNIAADLGISQRTVENHRAAIMKRTHTKSLPELARLVIASTPRSDQP